MATVNTRVEAKGGTIQTLTKDATYTCAPTTEKGGAVFVQGGTVNGENITFTGNTSEWGGAVNAYDSEFVDKNSVTFTGDTVSFINNSAEKNGGGVSNTGTLTFECDAYFSGNVVTSTDFAGGGGALNNMADSLIEFKGATVVFENNNATNSGGAIENAATIYASNDDEDVDISFSFTGNTATYKGGAVTNGSNSDFTISGDADFSGNASYDGGAIYNKSGISISGDAEFSGNSADNNGGAVYNVGGQFTVSGNAHFSNNTAVYGGAIKNYADDEESSIMIGNSDEEGFSVTFSGNKADGNGGAINNSGENAIITISGNAEFTDNATKQNGKGGAICNYGNKDGYSGCSITFEGDSVSFSGNTASAGGAVYNYTTNDSISFSGDVTFSKNIAIANEDDLSFGGAICNYGTIDISGKAVFDANEARGPEGWGSAVNSGGSYLYFRADLEVTNNISNYCGAVNIWDGNMSVSDKAVFSGNQSNGDDARGGALYVENYSESETGTSVSFGAETEFTNNIATAKGGAIYIEESNEGISSTIYLYGTTFTGNTAAQGGAIYIDSGTVEFGGVLTLSTESDTIYNAGNLNWDLTCDDVDVKVVNYQYVTNAKGGKQNLLISGEADEKFVIATGDFSGITEFADFTIAEYGSEESATISVDGDVVKYGDVFYYLSSGADENSDLLTLTSVEADKVLVTTPEKWFKKDDTITISGIVTGDNLNSVSIAGYGATVETDVVDGKWSCDLVYSEDTKGTSLTVAGYSYGAYISESDATYTLKIDSVNPEIALDYTDAQYVDESAGINWYKLSAVGGTISAKGSDVTSGLRSMTKNGEKYESETVDALALDLELGATTIGYTAADKAGNVSAKDFVYAVDGTAPVITVTQEPDADANYFAVKISATVTDGTGSGVDYSTFQYSTDGVNFFDYTEGTEFIVDEDQYLAEGGYTYTFRVSDKVGNEGSAVKTIGYNADQANVVIDGKDVVIRIDDTEVVDRENIAISSNGSLTVAENAKVETETLTLADGKLVNNGSAAADTLKVSGMENVISGNIVDVNFIELAAGAELGIDRNQYDSFMAGAEFVGSEGKLNVGKSVGVSLRTQDINTLMNKSGIANVAFEQDLISISTLKFNATEVAKTISFEDAYGTDGNDTIRFAKNSNVTIGQADRVIDLFEGSDKVQVDKNASATINSDLVNVSKIKSAKGSVVAMADIDFASGRTAVLKTNGDFSADTITGSDKSDKISIGKETVFTAAELDFGFGNDTLQIGSCADVEIGSLDFGDGKDKLNIGKDATLTVTEFDIDSLAANKLSMSKGSVLYLGTQEQVDAAQEKWSKYADKIKLA